MDESEKELKNLQNDYYATFKNKEGERVLADLESAYYDRISFNRDAYQTGFN